MPQINRKLLPVKSHYFFFCAELAGIVPFMLTLLPQLGVMPAVLGMIYAILPLVKLISKPLFGSIADKFQQHRWMFLICKALMTSSLFAIYFVYTSRSSGFFIEIDLTNTAYYLSCHTADPPVLEICNKTDSITTFSPGNPSAACTTGQCNETEQVFNNCSAKENDILCGLLIDVFLSEWRTNNESLLTDDEDPSGGNCYNVFDVHLDNISYANVVPLCQADLNYSSSHCVFYCNQSTQDNNNNGEPFHKSYVFAFMVFCMVVAWTGMAVAENTGDVLTLELLDEEKNGFGRQRVWGSIGWGLFAIISGQLIDYWSVGKNYTDYTPGFFIVLFVGIFDLLLSLRIKVTNMGTSDNMMKNIGHIFLKPEIVIFTIQVFAVGWFTGVLWTYIIVYLDSLGASQLLIGLTMASQCFLGEVPFFFIADWCLKKVGHGGALLLTFVIFAIRFALYYVMVNPWVVLVIEVTQGVNFGLFFTLLTTYASIIAPSGTAATVQGIEQAVFEGVGVGLGAFLGGILYEWYGGRTLFLICSLISVGCATLSLVACVWGSRRKRSVKEEFKKDKKHSHEMVEMLASVTF